MLYLRIRWVLPALVALLAFGCGSEAEEDNPGWSEFQQSDGDRTVYVSAEGDDAWDGLAASYQSGSNGPKRTLYGGLGQLRAGHADWLLLRRGDRFEGSLDIRVGGRSEAEPIVVSSFGEAPERPVVEGGAHIASRDRGEVDHLAVTDIRFEGGHFSALQGHHITIEACHFEGGYGAVYAHDAEPKSHWRVRRNTIHRTASTSLHFNHVQGLLIEDNVIYEPDPTGSNPAIFVSRAGSADVVTRGNLIYIGKDDGNGILQLAGGVVEENILVDVGWSAIALGACNDDDDGPCLDPVPVTVRGNAMLGGRGVGGGVVVDPRYVQPGAVVSDNLFLHGGPNGTSLSVGGDEAEVRGNVFHNALASLAAGNNLRWADNVLWTDRERALMSVHALDGMEGFRAEGNRYYHAIRAHAWFQIPQDVDFEQWRAITDETGSDASFDFVDPTRTLGTYFVTLGGPDDTEAFFQHALGLTRDSEERDRFTATAVLAYLREGYARR
jgi:hypothetical protein